MSGTNITQTRLGAAQSRSKDIDTLTFGLVAVNQNNLGKSNR